MTELAAFRARAIEMVACDLKCGTLGTALAGDIDLRKYAIALDLEENPKGV